MPEEIQTALSSKGCHGPLCAWAGVFQGALHSEAGAAPFPSDTL